MKHLTRVLPTLLRTLQCFCVLGLSFSPNWELLENRRGSDAKQSACRRPGSNPWVRKIPWRREWQPTPGFLSGEFHGLRSLAAYSPWGHKESDTTEQHTHTHTHTHTKTTQMGYDSNSESVFWEWRNECQDRKDSFNEEKLPQPRRSQLSPDIAPQENLPRCPLDPAHPPPLQVPRPHFPICPCGNLYPSPG